MKKSIILSIIIFLFGTYNSYAKGEISTNNNSGNHMTAVIIFALFWIAFMMYGAYMNKAYKKRDEEHEREGRSKVGSTKNWDGHKLVVEASQRAAASNALF